MLSHRTTQTAMTVSLLIFGCSSVGMAQLPSLDSIPEEMNGNEIEWIAPSKGESGMHSDISILHSPSDTATLDMEPTSTRPELVRQRFSNGSLQIERETVEDATGNFVNHGKYTEYNTKGEVIRSGKYSMGVLDSEWRQTISIEVTRQLTDTLDGGFVPPFLSSTTFLKGELSGAWTVTDSKGNLALLWQFEKGKRENTSLWYNSRGDVIREISFASNVPHGPAVVMDPSTKKTRQVKLDHGRILQTKTEWHDSKTKQKKMSETQVLVPFADRIVGHDWWNSRVTTESDKSTEPIRHGVASSWHVNGQLAFQGTYDQGKQNGEFVWYHENGQQKGRGRIQNDAKVGQWTWWHDNGMRQASGIYEEGLATGTWSAWSPEGRLLQRGNAEAMVAFSHETQQQEATNRQLIPSRSASRANGNTKSSRMHPR